MKSEEKVVLQDNVAIEEKKEKESFVAKFYSLDKLKQNELEKEFLNSDNKAFKFRQMELEFSKFSSVAHSAFWGSIFLLFVIRYLCINVFEKQIQIYNLLMASAVFAIISVVLGVIIFIVNLVRKGKYKRSMGKYVYMKKFQKWLKENKQIEYIPILLEVNEKEIFEQIDLSIMDL